MEKIVFNVGPGTEAYVGSGAVKMLGAAVSSAVRGEKAALVTDRNIPEAHVDSVKSELKASGFSVSVLAIAGGEKNKRLPTVEEVYGFLYDSGITRADAVIGLGGGVTGDIAGFAAATYMRGISYFAVPTTIIAQTDSAFGGKTGVDLRSGKNLIGCFYHPKAVVCDTDLLKTLPEKERVNGMGEVIKYGAIGDPSILDSVSGFLPSDDMIALCVKIKKKYVEADEYDLGERHILNFGHTYGHAIEEASDYSVPHGQAVAYGMLSMIRLGEKLSLTGSETFGAVRSALLRAGLDAGFEPYASDAFLYLSRDKKSDGKRIDAVLLRRPGEAFLKKLTLDELRL
ncbi:MAG: 3-dehydroquinate synthase [Clostridiales bacterium]|nr:3-dehydroquinate synthase [Clostridiales bacterium]